VEEGEGEEEEKTLEVSFGQKLRRREQRVRTKGSASPWPPRHTFHFHQNI